MGAPHKKITFSAFVAENVHFLCGTPTNQFWPSRFWLGFAYDLDFCFLLFFVFRFLFFCFLLFLLFCVLFVFLWFYCFLCCLFVGVAFFGLLYIVLFLFLCVFCFEGSDLNYYFYFLIWEIWGFYSIQKCYSSRWYATLGNRMLL